jgi:hypothetical protein
MSKIVPRRPAVGLAAPRKPVVKKPVSAKSSNTITTGAVTPPRRKKLRRKASRGATAASALG